MHTLFSTDNLDFFQSGSSSLEIPFGGEIAAGPFSDVDDFVSEAIDINKIIIKHPEATFFARVKGNSMIEDFADGDLLVIDRSVEWSDNKIALCYMNNEFTLKRIRIENDKCYLIPSNTKYKPIEVNAENNVMIWGIVTYSIKKHG